MVSTNCVLDQAFCLFICHKDHTGNAIYGDKADDDDDADDSGNAPEECFQELVQ